MKTHKFQALKPASRDPNEASGQIGVVCKVTGVRLPWNQAADAGWVADLNGEAFNAYYSPEGIEKLRQASA